MTESFQITTEDFNRAIELIRQKQVAEGCDIILDRMQQSSGESPGLVDVALFFWGAGFRDEPIEVLFYAHEKDESDFLVISQLARALNSERRFEELLPIAERLSELQPDESAAGLVRPLVELGAAVIWRCHIGHDTTDPIVQRTWEFLRPHLVGADGYVFTRAAYVPPWLNGGRVHLIPPSIDVFATKNQFMSPATVRAILDRIGLIAAGSRNGTAAAFVRNDGSPGQVERAASIVHSGALPLPRAPLAVQVSRWDRLKDMLGVMQGFVGSAAAGTDAYLALVGPDVRAVTDDPEGAAVFAECVDAWQALPRPVRDQVLLVLLPMDDIEENAAMVNAIQRHASVVIQKSLHEGFGLTVTEAMWKGRAIVASAVGGIQDQITNGKHGFIVDDPTDLEAFGKTLEAVLGDRALARRLGRNAQRRCLAHFLGPRHLTQYIDLFGTILQEKTNGNGNGLERR